MYLGRGDFVPEYRKGHGDLMRVTLEELLGDIYTAIAEASGAEVAALQARDNTANIRTTDENLRVWINEAADTLARRCVALRGRRRATALPGTGLIPFVDRFDASPELREYPVGSPCLPGALGRPWAVYFAGWCQGPYESRDLSHIYPLRPARPDVLQRWKGVVPLEGPGTDYTMPYPSYWASIPEQGLLVAPAVGRTIHFVFDTLNLPVGLVDGESYFDWLPVGGRRLLVAAASARVCEVRREDETLHSRAPEFWAEFYSGVVRLYNDLPFDVRGLFPVPEPGKMAKG